MHQVPKVNNPFPPNIVRKARKEAMHSALYSSKISDRNAKNKNDSNIINY